MRQCGALRGWGVWRLWLWAMMVVGACTIATAAPTDLYQAQTVVTGQGEDNRRAAFAACLEDVLIKVSGAFQLRNDARLAPLEARAAEFVTGFDYHDQMSGKPKHDEQGTRDRPYDLTVSFDRARIDQLLASLNIKPWPAPRPSIAVIVAMTSGGRTYFVASDDRRSDLQRDALRAAAVKRGLEIALPSASEVSKAAIERTKLNEVQPAAVASWFPGADVMLFGDLTWDDAELGWVTQWRLDRAGKQDRWQFRGVTFDEAFRRALGGAAQLLSDNGAP